MSTIVFKFRTLVNVQASDVVLGGQTKARDTVARYRAIRGITNVGTTTVLNQTFVLVHAKFLLLVVQGQSVGTATGHVTVLILTKMRTSAVVDQTLVDLHARLPIVLE